MEKTAKHYLKSETGIRQGATFRPFSRTGFTCLEVLPFLKGNPWDDVALGFVHSLRPSHIRVTTSGIQLDAQSWRVTVYLEKDGKTIRRIDQEVEVGLPDGVAHGAALHCALETGLDSPQTKWHAIPGTICHDGVSKSPRVYILGDDGKTHPYPKPQKK